ncbi:DUF2306 domain-containing protein [Amaricoccus tamworthensis]|uniref:DUF2306 domain-containing protein n=1 Tax=Amaricoccus tamworthensis TaxID=57002 RepID=UPI003C7AD892
MKSALFPMRLMAALSFLVALVSYRFVVLGLSGAFPDMIGHIDLRRTAFAAHVVAAPVALATGAMQFFPKLRSGRPWLHRWNGRFYGFAVLAGGVGGLVLSVGGAADRPVAALGFGTLALAWLATTAFGIFQARARNFSEHRKWMIRSFALTFAAVTLRLMLPVFFFGFGMTYAEASNWVAWLCWLPNLVLAQWLIRRGPVPIPPKLV